MALDQHTALEYLALIQLLPSVNSTDFDADHVLVAIVWCKVAHGLGLLDPGVPSDRVLDVIASDVEARLAVLQYARGVQLDVLVDTVDLAVELERGVCLGVGGGVEDLVDVLYAAKTVN